MKFSDLYFKPHHTAGRYPGKTHATAVLPNGTHISVIYQPDPEYSGPNGEPYEVLCILPGEDGDGIHYCTTPDELEDIIAKSAAFSDTPPLPPEGKPTSEGGR